MFQTKLALIILILFINFSILQICTPLSLPAIDISYVINKYFYVYGKHFVNIDVFYHDFITVTKMPFGTIDYRYSLTHTHG